MPRKLRDEWDDDVSSVAVGPSVGQITQLNDAGKSSKSPAKGIGFVHFAKRTSKRTSKATKSQRVQRRQSVRRTRNRP